LTDPRVAAMNPYQRYLLPRLVNRVCGSNDDAAAAQRQHAVHDQHVTIADADALHGVAAGPHHIGGLRVLDQCLVQVQAPHRRIGAW
jgi:hypothetical protein